MFDVFPSILAEQVSIKLFKMMKSKFPDGGITTQITYWDDRTFQVICKHAIGIHLVHIYKYLSSKDEIRYIQMDYDDDIIEDMSGKIISSEVITI